MNTTSFEWLTFFLGGAVGALLIVGLEKLFAWILSTRKYKKAKKQVTIALDMEIETNIDFCNQVINTIKANPLAVTFAQFDSLWLQTYTQQFIDFTNKDSLRLFSFLNGAKTSIEMVHDIQASLQMFHATSQALHSFNQIIIAMNQNLVNNTVSLKTSLEVVKKVKKDNKMLEDDVTQAFNSLWVRGT